MASYSSARVEKRESTLTHRTTADFDLPQSWRLRIAYPFTERLTIALAWQDLFGRPYTPFDQTSSPPDGALINSERLPRFQRLDAKVHYRVIKGSSDVTLFVDVINVLNRRNTATRSVIESNDGTYTSYEYRGARLFPIVGVSVKVW